MKITDIGRIDGPLMLFGGVYSNAQALVALEALGHPPDQMICTGDVVAYCADPRGVVARMQVLQKAGTLVIAGNVELQLAAGALDCGCGFESGTICDRLSAGWYDFANKTVGPEARDWMRDLPALGVVRHQGQRFAILHGGATDVSRFLWECSGDAAFAEEFAAVEALVGPVDGVIAGHCGIPFERLVAGVRWINAGVIGMPPHDGSPQTRIVILDGAQARVETLSYDWRGAQAEMVIAGLVQGYHSALETGIWPSEDVLPPELRRL